MSGAGSLLFTAIAAGIATVGFVFSVVAKYFDTRRSREISARQAWEKYLEMAFENPTLARAGYDTNDPDQFERYEWFVSRMLYASEEVMLLSSDDRSWGDIIKTQVGFHSDYLSGIGAQYVDHYSARLRPLIRSGLLEHA